MDSLTHWIFGYGSLLWNPGFDYVAQQKVRLPDYVRRMWQGSTDHRGTPAHPGLVCTLVPAPGDECWGLAYQIDDQHWPAIREQLDYREKDGYQLARLVAHFPDDEALEVWTYVADAANPRYVGCRAEAELVERMATAVGESGPNPDYLFRLEERLQQLGIEDPHVSGLARELRAWLTRTK